MEVKVGDTVIWVDSELLKHTAIVDKVKKDNKIDLHFMNEVWGRDTIVTDAHHKSIQDERNGDYWQEKP